MRRRQIETELRKFKSALTADETAHILRVSTKTIYRLIKENTLPAVKVGRGYRIAKSVLVDYLLQTLNSGLSSETVTSDKTKKYVWTCENPCGMVCVGNKNTSQKGVNKYGCNEYVCRKRTG